MNVSLISIDRGNYQAAAALKVTPEQARFVTDNALALVESLLNPGRTALAIRDDERQALVGLLVHELDATTGRWWLSHLMIDAAQQQRGYARRALQQLVAQLADTLSGKQLYARYHPANEAAQHLAAALGFQASAESSSDQIIVTLPLPTVERPPLQITLRDVTLQNARACIQLRVAPDQERFVASNAESLIQAKFEPHWQTKAIYNGDTMVGFTMYGYDPEFGWGVLRLMTDAAYQGRGYARAAMQAVLEHIRREGGTSVGISYEDENEVARQFYKSLGFAETGEQPFGEPFAVLMLDQQGA